MLELALDFAFAFAFAFEFGMWLFRYVRAVLLLPCFFVSSPSERNTTLLLLFLSEFVRERFTLLFFRMDGRTPEAAAFWRLLLFFSRLLFRGSLRTVFV
jgi:hypothetical protein